MKTMTEKAAAANRTNAARSTGPKTAEGKAAVAQNRLTHGLVARGVLPGEDPADLARLREALRAELNPVGELETELADRAAGLLFRLRRAERVETGTLAGKILGYLEHHEKIKRDILLASYESEKTPLEKEIRLAEREDLPTFASAFNNSDLAQLARHEAHLQRSLVSVLHELERLQRRRQGEALPAPAALDVTIDGGGDLLQ
jgi:hypothetical protein